MSWAEGGRRVRLYMSIAAQEDNLGDIAIRRVALSWIVDAGAQVTVLTGSMSPDYVAAIGIPSGVEILRGRAQFLRNLVRRAPSERAIIVFAPGPTGVDRRIRGLVRSGLNLALASAARWSGGGTISLGRAYRGRPGLVLRIEKTIAARALLHSVRDPLSSSLIGSSARLEPDLAFDQVAFDEVSACANGAVRQSAAICIRDAEQYPLEMLSVLIREARSSGLHPMFVTQVQRDNTGHARLARRFDVRHVSWEEGVSHETQWTRVREAYLQSQFVVSNRLHALLFGVEAMAVPVALGPSDKAPSTLEPFIELVTLQPNDASRVEGTFVDYTARAARLRLARASAVDRLVALRDDMALAVHERDSTITAPRR